MVYQTFDISWRRELLLIGGVYFGGVVVISPGVCLLEQIQHGLVPKPI